MNVNTLFRKIKDIARNVKTVRSVYDGDVYTIWNTSEVKYASFVVALNSAGRNDNTRTYTLIVYYGDRLLQDNSNEVSIWDDATNTIQTVVNKINSLDEEIQIGDYTIRYFSQKFSDDLAGAYAELTIEVEDELGDCEINDIITDDEALIERLEEAIRKYQEENAELAELLKDILHRISGEVV